MQNANNNTNIYSICAFYLVVDPEIRKTEAKILRGVL